MKVAIPAKNLKKILTSVEIETSRWSTTERFQKRFLYFVGSFRRILQSATFEEFGFYHFGTVNGILYMSTEIEIHHRDVSSELATKLSWLVLLRVLEICPTDQVRCSMRYIINFIFKSIIKVKFIVPNKNYRCFELSIQTNYLKGKPA